MQVNKNGIAIATPKKSQKRKKPNFHLPMRKFVLIDDEAEVEVVVPHFSPILDVLIKDGWRDVK
ncbi:MAG: hypothetical protein ABS882_03510 [Lysinibacillus sp.]